MKVVLYFGIAQCQLAKKHRRFNAIFQPFNTIFRQLNTVPAIYGPGRSFRRGLVLVA